MANRKETWQEALREAIAEVGGLAEMGRRTGFTHVAYHNALKYGKRISAEMAAAVAANSSVDRHRLRPDLWGPNE